MKAPVMKKFPPNGDMEDEILVCRNCAVQIVRKSDTGKIWINSEPSNILYAEEENCINYYIVVPRYCEGTAEKAPIGSEVKCLNCNITIGCTNNRKISLYQDKLFETWEL